jgi:hypothetical protein
MESRLGFVLLIVLVVLSAGAAFSWSTASPAREPRQDSKTPEPVSAADPARLSDAPLAEYRVRLLDMAYRTASALPLQPHAKNRARAQEAVVTDCIELEQARRALEYADGIANWRRGASYADLAFHLARKGETAQVQALLELARQIAETAPKEDEGGVETRQDWQTDRIRARIAQTHAWLGQAHDAERSAATAADADAARVAVIEATHADVELDEQLAQLDAVIATGSFDALRRALETCAHLFDRHYADAEGRARAQAKIESSWSKLPVPVRLELLNATIESALSHDDQPKAREILAKAQAMLTGAPWTPDLSIPYLARFAGLRHRAGEPEKARIEIDAAESAFEAQRERIVNIDRAGVLRALAECHATMGDVDGARKLYARAVEAGVENPNSRPRAEDLAATCRSMARNAVEPGVELMARMKQVQERLGTPW